MMHPVGFKRPEEVRLRHDKIVELRNKGFTLGQIAIRMGLGRTAVYHHAAGQCRVCGQYQ